MIKSHYIQSEIFQTFINRYFGDYDLELIKAPNLKYQKITILHEIITSILNYEMSDL